MRMLNRFLIGLGAISIFLGVWYAIFLLVANWGPMLEGMFFPVLGNVKIHSVAAQSDGRLVFQYTFDKYRNCGLVEISWFVRRGGTLVAANVVQEDDRSIARAPGKQLSFKWYVTLEGEYVAQLTYNCGMLWWTRYTLGPLSVRLSKAN